MNDHSLGFLGESAVLKIVTDFMLILTGLQKSWIFFDWNSLKEL